MSVESRTDPPASGEPTAPNGDRRTITGLTAQPSLELDPYRARDALRLSARTEPRDVGSDATMKRRWQALTLTAPIQQLVRNLAHVDVDADAYDTRQLALSAIDVVVASMGYGKELTLEDAQDHLVGIARKMCPDGPSAEAGQVVTAVIAALLNQAGESRRFHYRFANLTSGGAAWEDHSFKLLSLRETEHGDCLLASDQAVMLYVAALDTNLEDAEFAHAVMLRRQLADGRLSAAEHSAAQARRTSEGYAAAFVQLLEDTARDVSSHDWDSDVPDRLHRASKHIRSRLSDDDALLEYLRAGLDTDITPEVRATSGRIIDLLSTGKDMHLAVLDCLVGARDVHLQALTRQRLSRPRRLRLLSLPGDILSPALALDTAGSAAVTTAFGDAALGVSVPRQMTVNAMIGLLWAPAREEMAAPAAPAEPEFVDEGADPQSYPPQVTAAAQQVVAAARTRPTRLSVLVEAAASYPGLDADDREDTLELVLLSVLWAYDPVLNDDEVANQVDLVAADLEAVDDGTPMRHRWAFGTDLLVSARPQPEGPLDPEQPDAAAASTEVRPGPRPAPTDPDPTDADPTDPTSAHVGQPGVPSPAGGTALAP